MPDKQKVIKGLECCIVRNPDDKMRCSECPYRDPGTYCLNRLKMDALEVIKAAGPTEQEIAHAVNNVDRPEDVTFEQFAGVIANVCEALADLFEKPTCGQDYCDI